ncbi:MAG: toll/interleukin-1 receptor domain-containing protein, partial [Patescibacteria group bacterium]|nr:toll/interleukin-1 receptor domain-containing protein [Patescibacteria group bacterium]
MYEQDVEFPTADDELATALGIDHNVARATLKYLSEKNLIDLDDSKFTWYCMINVNGIDELEKFESEDRNQARNTDSEPAKLPTVFISHSIHDIDLAKHIKSWLEVVGISVFIAHQDLQPAKNFDVE